MFLGQCTPDTHANTSSTYTLSSERNCAVFQTKQKKVLACKFFDKRVHVTGLTENSCKIVRSIRKQLPMCTFVPLQLLPLWNDYTHLINQITKRNTKIIMILQPIHITWNSECDMVRLSVMSHVWKIKKIMQLSV